MSPKSPHPQPLHATSSTPATLTPHTVAAGGASAQSSAGASAPGRSLRVHRVLDRVGATGSLLCAVHCALMPLALAALPSLGLAAWLGESVETALIIVVTVMGLSSLCWGYRRHRKWRALGMLVLGLASLWLGALYPPLHDGPAALHAAVMTFGGTLVGLAHLVNLRLNHGHVHDAHCAH